MPAVLRMPSLGRHFRVRGLVSRPVLAGSRVRTRIRTGARFSLVPRIGRCNRFGVRRPAGTKQQQNEADDQRRAAGVAVLTA
jgi:hypothetical protein